MPSESGKLRIWNMALGYIGTRTVASENENCAEAIQCRLYWDSARRQALRDYPWNFAQRRASLAEMVMPELYAGEWQHAYGLPDECVSVRRILPPAVMAPWHTYANHACAATADDLERVPYRIVATDTDGLIMLLTDAAPCIVDYTADIETVAQWDDLFCGCMARMLASMIAIALLKNNTTKVNELQQLYRASVPVAMQGNAQERRPRRSEDGWLMVR